MQDESSYWLQSASIVVTAEYHHPSILTPDFLRSQRIVPADWEPTESVTTPGFSLIRFPNQIEWTVNQLNLTVTEQYESEFDQNYQIDQMVVSYLVKLSYVPYKNLGLNCLIAVKRNDPQQWLTKRYLRDGIWPHDSPNTLTMTPKFTLDLGDNVYCHVLLEAGDYQGPDSQRIPAIMANCNVHHQGPLDVEGLCDAIGRRPKRQDFVIASLGRLLGGSKT